MDKEPSVRAVWATSIVLAMLGAVAWRAHWFLGVPFTLVASLLVLSGYSELTDPYVGAAIRAEAGLGYVVHCCAAATVVYAFHAAGAIRASHGRKRRHQPAA